MNCILLGARSDIGLELGKRLSNNDYLVWGWSRDQPVKLLPRWDLIICAIGTLKPVSRFFDAKWEEWNDGFCSNILLPLQLLHTLYHLRNEGASVCFFGGTNPYKANPYYSAYASSKAALRMFTRDLALEYPELKVFMLDTGFVQTKIHEPTIKSGIYNERLEKGGGTTHDQIYQAVVKCLSAPIDKVSGKHFFVPHIT